MKCESKCIRNDLKKDYRMLDLKSVLIIVLIPFIAVVILHTVLNGYIFLCLSILVSSVALIYFALLGYFTWIDAVHYCKNKQGVQHG